MYNSERKDLRDSIKKFLSDNYNVECSCRTQDKWYLLVTKRKVGFKILLKNVEYRLLKDFYDLVSDLDYILENMNYDISFSKIVFNYKSDDLVFYVD